MTILERASGKLNVATQAERKTQLAVFFRTDGPRSAGFMNKLIGAMGPLP